MKLLAVNGNTTRAVTDRVVAEVTQCVGIDPALSQRLSH